MVQFSSVTQSRPTLWELMVSRGEGWGQGMVRECGMDMHMAVFEMENKQDLLQHREPCSGLRGSRDGSGVGGEWVRVYIRLSPFTVQPKPSQHRY